MKHHAPGRRGAKIPAGSRLFTICILSIACGCAADTGSAGEAVNGSLVVEVAARFPAAGELLAQAEPGTPAAPGRSGFRLETRARAPAGRRPGSGRWKTPVRAIAADLPADAAGWTHLRAAGKSVGVRRLDAPASAGRLDGGAVVYESAGGGADSIWLARDGTVEELALVREPGASPEYEVDIPAGWSLAAPQGYPGLVEIRGPSGVAWMRAWFGAAWDAAGAAARLTVTTSGREIHVTVEGTPAWPVLVDPLFSGTATPVHDRHAHVATLLPSGKVLVAGGHATGSSKSDETAELYDPATGTFTATGSMILGRKSPFGLPLPDGRALVGGGLLNTGNSDIDVPAYASQVYEEETGAFAEHTIPLGFGNFGATATLLAGPGVLLIDWSLVTTFGAGASDFDAAVLEHSMVLKPGRGAHTATLLGNGEVLVAGGWEIRDDATLGVALDEARRYDPATGTFSPAETMLQPRAQHTATRLRSGRVLLVGGVPDDADTQPSEIYDPQTHTFVAGAETRARQGHTATLLPSGEVLLVGGAAPDGPGLAELFVPDPDGGPGQVMPIEHATDACFLEHTATLLPTGKVLLLGGCVFSAAELFDPEGDAQDATFDVVDASPSDRGHHTATLLPSGKVLIAGGDSGGASTDTALLFDPSEGALSPVAARMTTPRSLHTATLLPSGKVLIAGGTDGAGSLASAELFDPGADGGKGTFVEAASMGSARQSHTATLLPSGKVLLAGGYGPDSAPGGLASAEVFDEAAGPGGRFEPTGSLHRGRFSHAAVLLPSGKVLFAGGQDEIDAIAEAEVFDPLAGGGTFEPLGSPAPPDMGRVGITATLLPSGKVLLVGLGEVDSAHADLYDPDATAEDAAFSRTEHTKYTRAGHTATLLPSGKVLLAGGRDLWTGGPADVMELYDSTGVPGTGRFVRMTSGGARTGHTATLLPSGGVLIVGGTKQAGAMAGVWREGGGADEADRPWISTPQGGTGRLRSGEAAEITGGLLRGVSDASGGNRAASPTGLPVAIWMSSGGGWVPGGLSPWSDTAATWTVPRTALLGPGLLFVAVNGTPSRGIPIVLGAGLGAPCAADDECPDLPCVDGVCCESACADCAMACSAAIKGTGKDGDCGPITVVGTPCCTSNLDCPEPQVCRTDGRCGDAVAVEPEPGGCGAGGGSSRESWPILPAALGALAWLRRRRRRHRVERRARQNW